MTDTTDSATFNITITDIKTMPVGNLTDVVKQVTWTIIASKGGKTSELLAFNTLLQDPQPEQFTPFSQLTEPQVLQFIGDNDVRLVGIKNYLTERLDAEIARDTLTSAPIPWAK